MSTNKALEKRQLRSYIALDFVSAGLAYTALHFVRKTVIEPSRFGVSVRLKWDDRFFEGLIATALVYIAISALSGLYRDLLRRSRLAEGFNTLGTAGLTSLFLFFLLFLDDYVKTYNQYYITFFTYFGVLLLLSGMFRFVLSTRIRRKIDNGSLRFSTLLVGCGKAAGDLLDSFSKGPSKGYHFMGYLCTEGAEVDPRVEELARLGATEQLKDIINDNPAEDVIIAVENEQGDSISKWISSIESEDIRIHVLPNVFSILTGQVKMQSLGRSLVEVKRELVKPHVAVIKRAFDILVASTLLLLTSPITIFSMIMIAVGSKGPLFFKQQRLGKRGKPFHIYKLRSMYADAEKHGPQLSSEDDPRITPWGRTMRKYRFDELPQFINVLKGDMAIVGPRPERKFYFDQIIERAPQYRYLLRVKPGLTSWGMVKFGYAENVDEMVERARYDLIYTENITLLNDIKILFYTLVIVLQGRGK